MQSHFYTAEVSVVLWFKQEVQGDFLPFFIAIWFLSNFCMEYQHGLVTWELKVSAHSISDRVYLIWIASKWKGNISVIICAHVRSKTHDMQQFVMYLQSAIKVKTKPEGSAFYLLWNSFKRYFHFYAWEACKYYSPANRSGIVLVWKL